MPPASPTAGLAGTATAGASPRGAAVRPVSTGGSGPPDLSLASTAVVPYFGAEVIPGLPHQTASEQFVLHAVSPAHGETLRAMTAQ